MGVTIEIFLESKLHFGEIYRLFYTIFSDIGPGCYPRTLLRILHAFWFILLVIYHRLFREGSGVSPQQFFYNHEFIFMNFIGLFPPFSQR